MPLPLASGIIRFGLPWALEFYLVVKWPGADAAGQTVAAGGALRRASVATKFCVNHDN